MLSRFSIHLLGRGEGGCGFAIFVTCKYLIGKTWEKSIGRLVSLERGKKEKEMVASDWDEILVVGVRYRASSYFEFPLESLSVYLCLERERERLTDDGERERLRGMVGVHWIWWWHVVLLLLLALWHRYHIYATISMNKNIATFVGFLVLSAICRLFVSLRFFICCCCWRWWCFPYVQMVS